MFTFVACSVDIVMATLLEANTLNSASLWLFGLILISSRLG